MSNKKIWFITGAGRGMGADFAKGALAVGHWVVAAARDTHRVFDALGQSDQLLPVRLDVTSRADAEAAVQAAVDRFGRIDVLVNNAASFYAGFFEELTPEQFNQQFATSLIGPMNVTRAVLPVMRKQRSGHIISISSTAGLTAGYRLRDRVRGVKVRPRGLDGVATGRGGALRHQYHHRQSRILSHGAPHRAIDDLRRAVDRRL